MKSFSYFFCLIIAYLFMLSCSTEEDGPVDTTTTDVLGTWQLTQLTVSSAIDANNDGITATNLLEEVDCLNEVLTITVNGSWNLDGVAPALISSITGNLYNVTCSEPFALSGNWEAASGTLQLNGGVLTQFTLSGDQLIQNVGDDLPGIRTKVYQRQ